MVNLIKFCIKYNLQMDFQPYVYNNDNYLNIRIVDLNSNISYNKIISEIEINNMKFSNYIYDSNIYSDIINTFNLKINKIESNVLKTREAFINEPLPFGISKKFSGPVFKCPKCGSSVRRDYDTVLMIPSASRLQYTYICDNCDYKENIYK